MRRRAEPLKENVGARHQQHEHRQVAAQAKQQCCQKEKTGGIQPDVQACDIDQVDVTASESGPCLQQQGMSRVIGPRALRNRHELSIFAHR